jgi:NAD(P)-dependent dehydrogenase (short-subunit alcohol dehydrogenase family)
MARSLATDLKEKGVVVVIMRPGYVNTMDMRKLEGAIDPEEAVHKLWRVFKTKGPEQTGMLWHREGKALPW